MPVWDEEFDNLVWVEAYDLCQRREGAWQIDHIVPIHHRAASGLHNGFNVQAVPALWNQKKNNKSMDTFFPIRPTEYEAPTKDDVLVGASRVS